MERTNTKLYLAFAIAALLQTYYPFANLGFLIPPLIISIYMKPFTSALVIAVLAGSFLDLTSMQEHLGLHAAAYLIAMILIYGRKRNFFQDSLTTIPIMTFFFSCISSIALGILINAFDTPVTLSKEWLFQDVFVYGLLDALYGFILFTLTTIFLPRFPKREYFS